MNWRHLSGIKLADPDFGTPGRIDLLLRLRPLMSQGRRSGAPGTPAAFSTHLDWVLPGGMSSRSPSLSLLTGDDLIWKFWEIEDSLVLLVC